MPKKNIWKDPSPYGTYSGDKGNPEEWKSSFEYASYSREKSEKIMKKDSPWDILGIVKDSTIDQIKSAWRKLCILHHPDKGGNREKFEKVMAAYSILMM